MPANAVMGRARIDGRPVAVTGDDFTVRGGSADATIKEKDIFIERFANQYRVPLVRMIEAHGQLIHHYIAAVPGRPLMMAVADGKPVIDLPGPTLAAYYGTQWCLQAIVARFLDIPLRKIATVQARSAAEVSGPPQMANIARVNLMHDKSSPTGYTAQFLNFKAGDLAACMASNAQRISPLGERGFAAGELVEVDLLRGEEFID